jgi:hypothetical protein
MKYVGIDWATEIHTVALVDEDGKLLAQWEVAHSRRGVDGLLQRLAREGGPEHLRITIESGAPLLVDQLLENGYREVFEMNPKQADRFRDRRSPSGCKDDWRDAWACADAGRTDVASLTRVVPDSDATGELLTAHACPRAPGRTPRARRAAAPGHDRPLLPGAAGARPRHA